MYCLKDSCTDPYWNLAAEEYLLRNAEVPLFRLWRNEPAVIVGRNQNAHAEINRPFVEERGIAVVRRLTGGGAVFHDLGNVNFTFIDRVGSERDSQTMFRRFTAPILEALRGLGVEARLEGRNDLTLDGAKFSGNAMCIDGDRVLQHGTLLYSASVEDISQSLLPRPEKYAGRSVASVRSRVTNISSHLPRPMPVTEFIDYLAERVGREAATWAYSEADRAAIDRLAAEKYRTDAWNFGRSPAFSFNACRKFPGGLLEVSLDIREGIIRAADLRGDYFFRRPTEEFCTALCGCPYTKEAVTALLGTMTVDDFFCGVSGQELLSLLF